MQATKGLDKVQKTEWKPTGEMVKELDQVSQANQTTIQEREKVVDETIANREE